MDLPRAARHVAIGQTARPDCGFAYALLIPSRQPVEKNKTKQKHRLTAALQHLLLSCEEEHGE